MKKVIEAIIGLPFLFTSYFIIFIYRIKTNIIKNKKITKPKLMFGTAPIINFKYWNIILKKNGYTSTTIVDNIYSINNNSDFDLNIGEKIFKTRSNLLNVIQLYVLRWYYLIFMICKYDIIHFPSHGFLLKYSSLFKFESYLMKLGNCKSVVLPYGSDIYCYSEMKNEMWKNGIISSYPESTKYNSKVKENVKYWSDNSDTFVSGLQSVDSGPRNDVITVSTLCITDDMILDKWQEKKNNKFVIAHSPNHRGAKGTEYLVKVCQELVTEGYPVELRLLEGLKNDEVLKILRYETDILAEQFLFWGYGLSGIEGMANGLPVLSNLTSEYLDPFRYYSYLNECPILSTNLSNMKSNIKLLFENKKLRKNLGNAGIEYVKKYHSEKAAIFMFQHIYDKIWNENNELNLRTIYHPLNPLSLNNKSPFVKHPLVNNEYL